MIKIMICLVKVITTICLTLLFSACKYDIDFSNESITGSGNVITSNRNLTEFTNIKVSQGLDCEVTQGDQFEVIVEADDNLQNGIITRVENGELKITSKYNSYNNVVSKKIKVKLPIIDGLETTSGSSLKTNQIIKSNVITVITSSGSQINATINSENITCESSSGSQINVSGIAMNLSTASSSGSFINATRLTANDVIAQASNGSNIKVNAVLILNAKASSGGSVEYKNTPKKIIKQESSGGSVSGD